MVVVVRTLGSDRIEKRVRRGDMQGIERGMGW